MYSAVSAAQQRIGNYGEVYRASERVDIFKTYSIKASTRLAVAVVI